MIQVIHYHGYQPPSQDSIISCQSLLQHSTNVKATDHDSKKMM